MPDLTSLLSLQTRSRRNARTQMLLMRRERAEAAAAQALLGVPAPLPGGRPASRSAHGGAR